MQDSDSIIYDSILANRPLPKWLIDQKEGFCTTTEPEKIVMKEDRSLQTSFALTAAIIFLIVVALTVFTLIRNRRQ